MKISFDSFVASVCGFLPYIGNPILKYYTENETFSRFVKYGVSISIQFWLLRAPLVWWLTGILPDKVNVIVIEFPGYLLASFSIGLILTIGGFFINEYWVWIGKTEK